MWAGRKSAAAALAAAAWLTGASLAGQQTPPAQSGQTFRSGAQVVEVDLRVFTRDGRFVTDLRPDEVEILEDGVAQQIVAMQLVDATGPTSPPSTTPTSPPSTVPTPNPRTHVPTTPSQTWIFFFDLNHMTSGAGFERARKGAADFARERFREGDLAGVVAGNRMVNNRLSSNRGELISAIEGLKPISENRARTIEITREWPRFLHEEELMEVARNNREALARVVTRACTGSEAPPACMDTAPSQARQKALRLGHEIERATLETFNAINVLANGLARMPGPKTIVLLGDGFVSVGMETTLRTLVGQVARSGARIYAIDTRGLNRGRGAGIIDQPAVIDEAGAVVQFDALEDGPNSLSVDTGGMMIRNENNVGRALDRISEDSSRYYVLGYQPTNTAFDGKYRDIEVRVKRDGVHVRARKGYLAIEPAKMLLPRPLDSIRREEREAASAETPSAAATPPAAAEPTPPVESAVRMRPDAVERVAELAKTDVKTDATPGLAEAEAARGWEAYQRGDLEAALPPLEAAASRPDVRPWALYVLGLTRNGLGHAREAVASWERVRTAVPDYPQVYMDLAATYGALGDLSNALAVLREAEKRWPHDPEVHNGIGVILVRRGALDEAIEAFQKAADAAPDEAVTHLNLGRAYELRYMRDLRYVSTQRRWVSREEDRRKAAESYERCVALGGPYSLQARQALSRLEWARK